MCTVLKNIFFSIISCNKNLKLTTKQQKTKAD